MNKRKLVVIHEFGTLIKEGEGGVFLNDKEDEVELPELSFNNLWDFILENKTSDDLDQVMSVHKKKGREYIKCSRYVGTIQTKDGCTIEILPKIYGCSSRSKEDIERARKIFLNMLRHFKDSDSRSFQNANLSTSENFPILEVYISNYISETEELLRTGIKKNYTKIQENSSFLKGRLFVQKQICKNLTDKTHFQIEYTKYLEDIPQNRLIVSTLNKLLQLIYSNSNKARIYKLLAVFSEIPESSKINSDLQVSLSANRLFASYENLMQWSSQFLLNKGFTTFSGNHVNQSLLFSAEKLFESYVAALFKSYTRRHPGYDVHTQHKKYFLVDKHNKHGKFQLRPDIFVESTDKSDFTAYENIILDTKWKIIDENKPDKNYFVSISDMYQLYAYGQKYALGDAYFYDVQPRLVLIYPATASFTKELPAFFYEELKKEFGLRLTVCPFNLSKLKQEEIDEQIQSILDAANKNELSDGQEYSRKHDLLTEPAKYHLHLDMDIHNSKYMLFGYVKSPEHFEWIKNTHLYNGRMGSVPGELSDEDVLINPSRIVLYDKDGNSWMCTVNQSEELYFDSGKIAKLGYPDPHNDYYKLFRIQDIKEHGKISLKELNEKYNCYNENKGKPVFVRY